MKIIELKPIDSLTSDKTYLQFFGLLKELRKKKLPDSTIIPLNRDIEEINSSMLTGKERKKIIKAKQLEILKQLESEHKIVIKKHYQNLWTALGITLFGLPIGLAFGFMLHNMGFLGMGMSFGLVIGLMVGMSMDKKALKEGRQLDVE